MYVYITWTFGALQASAYLLLPGTCCVTRVYTFLVVTIAACDRGWRMLPFSRVLYSYLTGSTGSELPMSGSEQDLLPAEIWVIGYPQVYRAILKPTLLL